MKVASRGTFKTVVNDDNSSVVCVFRTSVSTAPRLRDGKTYVSVLVDKDDVSQSILFRVDDFIKLQVPNIEYSPLLLGSSAIVMKLAARALADPDLAVFDDVEVHAKLGNFGTFGYCWNVTNIFRI